tara:strand:- start:49 stop:420 length:372 start_codon:yes stop_codon:yes gene_type:complete
MSELKYQSSEWVEIQNEMYQDENTKSIMDEFNSPPIMTKLQRLQKLELVLTTKTIEYFYCIRLDVDNIYLQGTYNPKIFMNICDTFNVKPSEWLVQKYGFLVLDIHKFNINGQDINLKFTLTH